jgi:hypothetical protein
MNWLKKFFGHLKTILTHKKWVFYYMSKLGFPFRGFVHDFSKLSPTEFFEGVRFWDGKRSPVLVAKERLGISYAWLHHRGRNKHHYEYWIDKLDQGGVPQPIPFKYVIEMVCDWFAAASTYDGVDRRNLYNHEYEWWMEKSKTAKIHPDTKKMIGKILWNFREYYDNYLAECEDDSMNPEKCAEDRTFKAIKTFINGWKYEYETIK